MCTHDWQPIPTWYARYRCSLCRAIGCKHGAVCPTKYRRSLEITPYRCESKCGGEKCGKDAVHTLRGRSFRCAEHAHDGGARSGRGRERGERPAATAEAVC